MIELSRFDAIQLLHDIPEGILLIDQHGVINLANSKAQTLFPNLSLLGCSALRVFAPTYLETVNTDELLLSFMTNLAKQSNNGIEFMTSQGMPVLVRIKSIRSLNPESVNNVGNPWWIVSIVDISEQKKTTLVRDETLQQLWHDLRAPQAAILALIGMHTKDTSEKNRQFLDRITHQVNSTLDLADDLVWQLRAESGKFEFQVTDMVQLCYEAIDLAWPLAQAKEIQLRSDLDHLLDTIHFNLDDLDNPVSEFASQNGLWLRVEPRLLQRAIFNLLENAIKYSPPQTNIVLRICIRTASVLNEAMLNLSSMKPDNEIEISVSDEGNGISMENLPNIFDSYTRFSTSTSADNKQSGHGIGLRFVKTVAEAHQGIVKVESQLSKGSTFSIILPYGNPSLT